MNVADGPRSPGEVIGTRSFIAIGILRRRRHIYRHDLESFLCVILNGYFEGSQEPPENKQA